MANITVAGFAVLTHMMEVEISLEEAVMPYHPIGVPADIGPDNFTGELVMIVRRERHTYIVQEGRYHHLFFGTITKRTARALQRVFACVHMLSGDTFEHIIHIGDEASGRKLLIGNGVFSHQHIIRLRPILHPQVADLLGSFRHNNSPASLI